MTASDVSCGTVHRRQDLPRSEQHHPHQYSYPESAARPSTTAPTISRTACDRPLGDGRTDTEEDEVSLLRRELGDVLRARRRSQGRTLREVSATASVSLGYLSEVERGEKEASSELLASICEALELPLSQVLLDVSSRMAESEGLALTVPLPVSTDEDVVAASAA